MGAADALALMEELKQLAIGDLRDRPLRDAKRCQEKLARAREICAQLLFAPGPPGLVREKVNSIKASASEVFGGSERVQADFILADLASLRMIIQRAVDHGAA
jgi:hypothetical protein